MSIYGGFSTRKLEAKYNFCLEQVLSLMSKHILTFITCKGEEVKDGNIEASGYNNLKALKENKGVEQSKFNFQFARMFSVLRSMEEQKYLPPKFSDTLRPLADSIGVDCDQQESFVLTPLTKSFLRSSEKPLMQQKTPTSQSKHFGPISRSNSNNLSIEGRPNSSESSSMKFKSRYILSTPNGTIQKENLSQSKQQSSNFPQQSQLQQQQQQQQHIYNQVPPSQPFSSMIQPRNRIMSLSHTPTAQSTPHKQRKQQQQTQMPPQLQQQQQLSIIINPHSDDNSQSKQSTPSKKRIQKDILSGYLEKPHEIQINRSVMSNSGVAAAQSTIKSENSQNSLKRNSPFNQTTSLEAHKSPKQVISALLKNQDQIIASSIPQENNSTFSNTQPIPSAVLDHPIDLKNENQLYDVSEDIQQSNNCEDHSSQLDSRRASSQILLVRPFNEQQGSNKKKAKSRQASVRQRDGRRRVFNVQKLDAPKSRSRSNSKAQSEEMNRSVAPMTQRMTIAKDADCGTQRTQFQTNSHRHYHLPQLSSSKEESGNSIDQGTINSTSTSANQNLQYNSNSTFQNSSYNIANAIVFRETDTFSYRTTSTNFQKQRNTCGEFNISDEKNKSRVKPEN